MVQNTSFSGTAPGLRAEEAFYNVDGVSGYVSKVSRKNEGAIFAKKKGWLLTLIHLTLLLF